MSGKPVNSIIKRLFLGFCAFLLVFAHVGQPAKGADSDYILGAFYAIRSAEEYDRVKSLFSNNDQPRHMYFQWARLAPDQQGNIRFTHQHNKPISQFDVYTEFGVPQNQSAGYRNKIDFEKGNPGAETYLSVFFSDFSYAGDRRSEAELLDMDEDDWDTYIIKPMVRMVNGWYNGSYSPELAFDGLVLDFEAFRDTYICGGQRYTEQERTGFKAKYNKFLSKVKAALGSKKLIVAVHPTNVEGYYDGYDLGFISNTADYILLMAYDYYQYEKYDATVPQLQGKIKSVGCYETQPYWLVREAVDVAISEAGVHPGKLILGLDLAGVKWTRVKRMVNGQPYFYYTVSRPYLDGIEEAVEVEPVYLEGSRTCKKVIVGQQAVKMAGDAIDPGDTVEKIEYYFESPASLYNKYQSIIDSCGIAGLSVWRMGTGSTSAWERLVSMPGEGAYRLLPRQDNTPPDKRWTVTFNMPLDEGTVNGNSVYVLDEWGYKIDTTVSMAKGAEGRSILVTPAEPYKCGHSYELVITRGVLSHTGVSLKYPIKMKFTIVNHMTT